MTDKETAIIRKCQQGDYDAFEVLVSTYSEKAFAVAYGVMGNQHDAADMTQEAFIKVYKNIGKFNFRSSFNTWLYRIVKNTCIDELRRQKRNRVVSIDSAMDGGDGEYYLQIEDESADIQEILEKEETAEMLWDGLDRLPENHREALVLADIRGYDYEEIAAMVGIPVGTVKSRISRARRKLAEILRNMGTI